jgi:hypothetical protein
MFFNFFRDEKACLLKNKFISSLPYHPGDFNSIPKSCDAFCRLVMGICIHRRENQAVVVPYDLGNQVAGLRPVNVNVACMHGAIHDKGTTAIKHAPLFN